MNLQEFLFKWGDNTRKLENMVLAGFECDPRTLRGWKKKTPGHAKLTLKAIDRLWTEKGKADYGIFFE